MRNWFMKLVSPAAEAPAASALQDGSVVRPAVIENLEDRRLCSSSLAYGINTNNLNSGTYGKITQVLRDTGTRTVRVWQSVNSYNDRSNTVFKFINRFHSDGFDVTVTVAPKAGLGGSYEQIKNYFAWSASQVGGAVGRWEVGNEPDHEQYWRGSLSGYVNNLLKPAYDGLKSRGETVVSAGVSWNPEDIKEMVNAGMLNYCDMVGYHPYRSDVSDLAKCVAQVKSYVNGKPLVATEWNVRGSSNHQQWADEIGDFWNVIRDNFYAAYYYAMFKSGTMAGAAGVITSGGSANGPFYQAYKDLRYSSAPAQQAPNKPAPNKPAPAPAKPATGGTVSKPPATPSQNNSGGGKGDDDLPDITGFRILDGDTGEVLVKDVSSSTTIKLSALKGRMSFKFGALTDEDAGSVKVGFTGYATHYENDAPYDVFIKDGKASSWAVKKGAFSLTADAYTGDNGTGKSGKAKTITLTFA